MTGDTVNSLIVRPNNIISSNLPRTNERTKICPASALCKTNRQLNIKSIYPESSPRKNVKARPVEFPSEKGN